jgi:hypothetical protein
LARRLSVVGAYGAPGLAVASTSRRRSSAVLAPSVPSLYNPLRQRQAWCLYRRGRLGYTGQRLPLPWLQGLRRLSRCRCLGFDDPLHLRHRLHLRRSAGQGWRVVLSACILRKNSPFPETDQWRQARARAWASGNKLTPQKANSRRKMIKHVLGQFYGPF